ncbi:MAG: hypothetical protein R3B13_07925 [Polyangiaceae bacterium]
MRVSIVFMIAGVVLAACSSDSDRPGPAAGGSGGSAGAGTGGTATGGSATDGGVQCADDHTEQGIGKTFSCGGTYCIPGTGCLKECTGPQDCRPGFTCQQLTPTLWRCG